AALLAWAGVSILKTRAERADCVRVYVGGELFAEARLDEARTIVAEQENGCRNEIEIADGRVRMKSSTCKKQLCVEQGWLEPGNVSKRSMGAHIVCLPNAVDVQLFASDADAPDA
ncbi:MAG: NusG domain II-containing protein, partial [Clostridia bacterium]|nr:NusG domain II-containing protein [Clostridia bacterium]